MHTKIQFFAIANTKGEMQSHLVRKTNQLIINKGLQNNVNFAQDALDECVSREMQKAFGIAIMAMPKLI